MVDVSNRCFKDLKMIVRNVCRERMTFERSFCDLYNLFDYLDWIFDKINVKSFHIFGSVNDKRIEFIFFIMAILSIIFIKTCIKLIFI